MGKKIRRAASGTYQVGADGVNAVGKPIVKGGKDLVSGHSVHFDACIPLQIMKKLLHDLFLDKFGL